MNNNAYQNYLALTQKRVNELNDLKSTVAQNSDEDKFLDEQIHQAKVSITQVMTLISG